MEKNTSPEKTNETRQPYFRDMLQTVDEKGKRKWIYPKRPSGKLFNYRAALATLLLIFFFAAPFIKFRGEPIFLLNIFERKFILFGQVFWPQDFYLIALSIIVMVVFIILFTVIYGRIFCGWVCPQTIFMEFFFRRVEYLIEGDFQQQKRLSAQPWTFEKIWKKSLKQGIFILMALAISHTLLAYIIGVEALGEVMAAGPGVYTGSFIFILLMSGFLYFIYSTFREQVCILLCPYGRLQGVLLDEKSVVVAYDHKRGEPRGAFSRSENRADAGKGDCIDCLSCVHVCPTGIDIRNGTQLECINCTACIDACNSVMKRVNLPTGLIRFDSEKGIETGKKDFFNARSIAYSVFLLMLIIVTTTLFIKRSDVEVTILRLPGSLYQEYGPDSYANLYKIQLVNKKGLDMPIQLKIDQEMGELFFIGQPITAERGKLTEANFMVVVPKASLSKSNTPILIRVYYDDLLLTSYQTNFIGPATLDQKQKLLIR